MSKNINCLEIKEKAQRKSSRKLKKIFKLKKIEELHIDDPILSKWLEQVKTKKTSKAA